MHYAKAVVAALLSCCVFGVPASGQNNAVKIGIPNVKGIDYLNAEEILYFESVNKYTKVVTKDTSMQPLAVSLANYISTTAGRAANPYGAILAGAVVLSAPAVALFVAFQKHFTASNLGSGVKG